MAAISDLTRNCINLKQKEHASDEVKKFLQNSIEKSIKEITIGTQKVFGSILTREEVVIDWDTNKK